jgi:choline dehydrogenase-like flavoprotein
MRSAGRAQHFPSLASSGMDAVRDIVVVGGGCAGCAIASQLKHDQHIRVLLEATAAHRPDATNAPALRPTPIASAVDCSHAVPNVGSTARCCPVPGGVLRGSSNISAMAFLQTHPPSHNG